MFTERILFFMIEYKRWLVAAACCACGALVLTLYFQSAPTPQSYIAANDAVAAWEADPHDETLYKNMKAALRKTPDLEKNYRPLIAQKLLERDRVKEALSWAGESLKGIEMDVPFHAAYGNTSMMIAQGGFQEALEQSVRLKEKMTQSMLWVKSQDETLKGGMLLYAHNLLRIACLQQELKNKPGEKAAWEEFEAFLNSRKPIAGIVYENFREKGVDLTHYILERKKHL